MEKEIKRLLELLKAKAFQRRKVILASGKESDFYIDCREVTLHPEGAYLTGKVMYQFLKNSGEKIDGVGAVPVGAIPIASAISLISHLEGFPVPAFVIRKEPKTHGTGKWIEGAGNLPDGARVAIVEDVITTGGSLLKSIEIAENNGLKVIMVMALVDREEGGKETIEKNGYKVKTLFRRSDFL